MIKPSIGRVVWYHPAAGAPDSDKTLAAIVCHVHNDTEVNLAVFDATGMPHSETNVYLLQEYNELPGSNFGYAEWMPYQLGQATRTQQAELAAQK